MIHFGGTTEFDDCFVEGDHGGCPFTTGPTSTGFYYECSCHCHQHDPVPEQEARECAGADDERRRAQFHADVRAIFGGPF